MINRTDLLIVLVGTILLTAVSFCGGYIANEPANDSIEYDRGFTNGYAYKMVKDLKPKTIPNCTSVVNFNDTKYQLCVDENNVVLLHSSYGTIQVRNWTTHDTSTWNISTHILGENT